MSKSKKSFVEKVTGSHDSVVAPIQDAFLRHADFVYFRKGEFEHALDVAAAYAAAIAAGIGIKVGAEATLEGLKSTLGRWRGRGSPVPEIYANRDMRFIMCDDMARPDALAGADALRELGFQSRAIQPDRTGRLRYFVSGEEFFVFFITDRRVEGIRGNDEVTRTFLQAFFHAEWSAISESSPGPEAR